MHQSNRRDEIDLVVDELMARPGRAEELLETLQRNKGATETPQQRRARLRLVTLCNDAEGLWDNVPI